ncbi:hypothetical protein [Sphingomonas montana]|uniref:hypothetical protein n=1 Tax=Sphingomonas montana TaxID=1843236 RepID=UPI001F0A91F8|nr:hypothetical protein [Sphingomonas montana]
MKTLILCALAASQIAAVPAAARAERSRDQNAAAEARRSGKIKSLREIEDRVIPRMMGARYLGPEFDAQTATYRLKFMRGGAVLWLDVDGRTGAVIGRSGE